MDKKLKLTTVVVTYNRKEILLRNLKSQFIQTYPIENLIIIDNHSNDGTEEYLRQNGVFSKENVKYFYTSKNLGGAGGFEYGIHKAYELETDIICLMDDDGYAINEDTFRNALDHIEHHIEDYGMPIFVNSMVVCNDVLLTFPYGGTIKTREVAVSMANAGFLAGCGSPFNATFINKPLIDSIGFPRGDFFIRYDEVDYFYKAKKCNAYLGVVIDSLYYHPEASKYENKVIFGCSFQNDYEAGWEEYYKTRNSCVLYHELGTPRRYLLVSIVKRIIGMFVFKIPYKKELYGFLKAGYKDAKKQRMGMVVKPGQASYRS